MTEYPIQILSADYLKRRKKNPQYSLRAYARLLGINSGALSQILSKKRPLTLKQAYKIVPKLELSHRQRKQFVEATQSVQTKPTPKGFLQLKDDEFSLISDWYHYAIINLIDTKDFKPNEEWIASRLGITNVEAREALARLERLELIEKKGSDWIISDENYTTTQDVPSTVLKHSHEQAIEQAKRALWDVDVHMRDISTISMAVDIKKIAQAKSLIREFRRKLCALLEDGDQTEVYSLNIQLFPITKVKKTKGTK